LICSSATSAFPAHAGIDLKPVTIWRPMSSLPRARGDRPYAPSPGAADAVIAAVNLTTPNDL